jgi:hypothetical protein
MNEPRCDNHDTEGKRKENRSKLPLIYDVLKCTDPRKYLTSYMRSAYLNGSVARVDSRVVRNRQEFRKQIRKCHVRNVTR